MPPCMPKIHDNQPRNQHHSGVESLWPFVSLSKEQYQKTYQTTDAIFAKMYPNATPYPLTTTALRVRKSMQLPVGASPEIASKTAEQWTFAVFVASLSYAIGKLDTIDASREFVRSILNYDSLQWLDPVIGTTLIDACCKTHFPNNPISHVLQESLRCTSAQGAMLDAPLPTDQERRLVQSIESEIRASTLKCNTPGASVHIYYDTIFVLETYLLALCSTNELNSFKLIKPMSFQLRRKKNTLILKGYGWESLLIREIKLDSNFRIQPDESSSVDCV